MSNRNSLMAQVHIARKELMLDDDTYRSSLNSATGKTSCADMGVMDLHKAVQWFKDHGWKPKNKGRKYSPKSAQRPSDEKTQREKIRALWIGMAKQGLIRDGSERGLGNWVRRMTAKHNGGIGWQALEFVPEGWLSPLIEDLKRWKMRLEDAE
jgi:phage gp16-like protein